jgi:hypothetical protein
MAKLILDTDAALYETLGLMTQARALLTEITNQEPDSYEMSDAGNLLSDAITQLRGEIANRQEGRAA